MPRCARESAVIFSRKCIRAFPPGIVGLRFSVFSTIATEVSSLLQTSQLTIVEQLVSQFAPTYQEVSIARVSKPRRHLRIARDALAVDLRNGANGDDKDIEELSIDLSDARQSSEVHGPG